MKKKMIAISFALLFLPCVAIFAEDSFGFDLANFDITIPGNGYFFSWSPNVGNSSYRVSLLTGYGQIFQDDREYLDSLLYKGGFRFETGLFGVDAMYSKDFTKLAYAYFDSQKGVSGNASFNLSEGVSVGYNIFYGELGDAVVTSPSFFYQQAYAKGITYFGLASDLSWLMNLSQYRDFDSDDGGPYWGINSAVNLALANDFFNSRWSFGYVENGPTGISRQMKYDFAAYAPGVAQGVIAAETFFVSENKVRLFPFSYSYTMPSFLEMIYAGGLFNAGFFLPDDTLVGDGKLTYYTGACLGFLFFKSDLSVSFAYCPDTRWVIQFRMIQKDL